MQVKIQSFKSSEKPLLCLLIQIIVYWTSRAACLHVFVKSRENVYKSKSEAYFFTILLFFGFYIALMLTLTALLLLDPPDKWWVLEAKKTNLWLTKTLDCLKWLWVVWTDLQLNFFSGPFITFDNFYQPLNEALFGGPSDLRMIYNVIFSRRLVLSIIVILLGVIYFYRLAFLWSQKFSRN